MFCVCDELEGSDGGEVCWLLSGSGCIRDEALVEGRGVSLRKEGRLHSSLWHHLLHGTLCGAVSVCIIISCRL